MKVYVYRVERSFLVRRTEAWSFESPLDPTELEAWKDADFPTFDEAVCGFGTVLTENTEVVDDDDLTIESIDLTEVGFVATTPPGGAS